MKEKGPWVGGQEKPLGTSENIKKYKNLRRSATEAQLGLEFGGVSKIEFEFEFLFQPWLKFTFELECEFDFGVKSEFAVEVVPESGASRKWSSSSSSCFNPGSSFLNRMRPQDVSNASIKVTAQKCFLEFPQVSYSGPGRIDITPE